MMAFTTLGHIGFLFAAQCGTKNDNKSMGGGGGGKHMHLVHFLVITKINDLQYHLMNNFVSHITLITEHVLISIEASLEKPDSP